MRSVALILASLIGGGQIGYDRLPGRVGNQRVAADRLTSQPIAGNSPAYTIATRGPSVDNVSRSLTINGQTETPVACYNAADATAEAWAAEYGPNLTEQSAGSGVPWSSPFGASTAIFLLGTEYYQAAAGSNPDIDTKDVVIEVVSHLRAESEVIWSTRDVFDEGIEYRYNTGGLTNFAFEATDGTVVTLQAGSDVTNTTDDDEWAHQMLFFDRSQNDADGITWYKSGIDSGSTNGFTLSGKSLTSTAPMTIGARSNGTAGWERAIAYVCIWAADDWLDGGKQDAIAENRADCVTMGECSDSITRNSASGTLRSGPAYLVSSDDYYHRVHDHWGRYDYTSTYEGIYSEGDGSAGVENLILQSSEFDTSWALADAGDTIDVQDGNDPRGYLYADAIIADSTDGNHGVTQVVTVAAGDVTFAVHASAGNQWGIRLRDTATANTATYFRFSDCSAQTTGSAVDVAYAYAVNSMCRFGITYAATGGASTFEILVAEADGDVSFAGDGSTDNAYLWGASLTETGYLTQLEQTTTAAVTAAPDYHYWDAPTISPVALSFDYVSFPRESDNGNHPLVLVGNSATTNQLTVFSVASAESYLGSSASAGGNAGSVTCADLTGGTASTACFWVQENDAQFYIDGAECGSADTTVDVPGSTDRIRLGMTQFSTVRGSQWVKDISVFETVSEDPCAN